MRALAPRTHGTQGQDTSTHTQHANTRRQQTRLTHTEPTQHMQHAANQRADARHLQTHTPKDASPAMHTNTHPDHGFRTRAMRHTAYQQIRPDTQPHTTHTRRTVCSRETGTDSHANSPSACRGERASQRSPCRRSPPLRGDPGSLRTRNLRREDPEVDGDCGEISPRNEVLREVQLQ